jgi:hypothetical protein
VAKYQSTTDSTASCIAVAHRRYLLIATKSVTSPKTNFIYELLYRLLNVANGPASNRQQECQSSVEVSWWGSEVGRVGQVVQCPFVVGRDVRPVARLASEEVGAYILTAANTHNYTLCHDPEDHSIKYYDLYRKL